MEQKQKCILITGASSGIGAALAVRLAGDGHKLILAGRHAGRIDELRKSLKNHSLHIPMIADFASVDQVWKMAERVYEETDTLDVLVNNAGAAFGKRQLSADGYELTLAVNHLAPFVLGNLLLPILMRSADPRMINVSSNAHYYGKINVDDLQYEKGYFILKAYAQSKLANILFTCSLASKPDLAGLAVNAVHPGVVKTSIGAKHSLGYMGSVWHMITAVRGISVEQGADNSYWLASSKEGKTYRGAYFHKREIKNPSPEARDSQIGEWLWKESCRLTGITDK
jgi:NAD(P)-dependent dehydrogenase (short-subunit alcohol dehydrogenase family)